MLVAEIRRVSAKVEAVGVFRPTQRPLKYAVVVVKLGPQFHDVSRCVGLAWTTIRPCECANEHRCRVGGIDRNKLEYKFQKFYNEVDHNEK